MPAGIPNFDVQRKWIDRAVVVSVRGDVDALTAPQLADVLDVALAEEPAAVVVDFSAVDFLASTGMTVLLTARERLAPPAKMMVVADGPGTSRPLKLMAIDRIVPVHPTLDDALGTLADA